MPYRQVRYYRLALIVSAILLVIWQYTIVSSKSAAVSADADDSSELSFTTNTGSVVTIPSGSDRFTVVIFWKAASERSLRQVAEALSIYQRPEFDTLAVLYLVNLDDSLMVARSAVDFDNPDLPFARSPKGAFLNRHQIRSLPFTAIFAADGSEISTFEGYQEGGFADLVSRLQLLNRVAGQQGQFQFQFGGKSIR